MACSLFHRQVILSALLFLLQKAQACPSACECYGTTVNCTGRNLVSIPANIPSNAVTLLLGHNKISSVSTTDLSDLDELRILDLSHNELTALHHEQFVFQNSPKLEDLRLDFNKISFELDGFAEPFVGLEDSLKRLSISHNLISGTLKRYQLKYHYKLQYLDLSYNVITAIQTKAFPASLTNLNIAYNKIILWSRSLRSATGLKTLDVRGLAMTGMTSSYFQYSQSLESLKISGSRLTSVFGSLLYGLEALKYVEISDSKITTLPARFFSYTPLLTVANLTNNSISSFESDVAASKLEKLILDQNVLSDFSFLTKFSTSWSTMKLLSLKSNDISTSPALAVKEFPNLETLVVAYNRISDVTPMKSSKLVTIDLSYNSIDSVKPAVFENCSALTNVDFSGNRIASLAQDFEPSSIQWSLSVNPWDCGCNLVTTYQALQSSSARFTCGQSATPATECFVCSTPSNLNGQSIANVINSVSASCGVSVPPHVPVVGVSPVTGNNTIGVSNPNKSTPVSSAVIGAVVAVTMVLLIAILVLVYLKYRGKFPKKPNTRGESIVPIANADVATYCELNENTIESNNYEQISSAAYVYGTIDDKVQYSYAKNDTSGKYAMADPINPIVKRRDGQLTADNKIANRLSAVEAYILPESTPKKNAAEPSAPPIESNPYLTPIPMPNGKFNFGQTPASPYMELDSRASPNAYELD